MASVRPRPIYTRERVHEVRQTPETVCTLWQTANFLLLSEVKPRILKCPTGSFVTISILPFRFLSDMYADLQVKIEREKKEARKRVYYHHIERLFSENIKLKFSLQ